MGAERAYRQNRRLILQRRDQPIVVALDVEDESLALLVALSLISLK
jgi:hypothetical protein